MMKTIECDLALKKQPWNKVPRPHVSFVCDEHETHSPKANKAYLRLKNKNPVASKYMASYTYDDDKRLPVLQAADALVYEVRRSTNIGMRLRAGEWRKQFKMLDANHRMGLIQIANKENLLNTVKLHKPKEPFKLDEIMDTVFHANVKFEGFENDL
jgi:hypothetical protein